MVQVRADRCVVDAAAVLFDKDCTLLDSLSYWPHLAERRVSTLARDLSLPDHLIPVVYRAMGLSVPEMRPIPKSPLVLGPRRDTAIAVATVLFLDGLDWDKAVQAVIDAFQTADRSVEQEGGAKAFPEARPLLDRLRQAGLRVGVLTNDDRERSIQALAREGLGELVEAVAGGDEVKNPKPDPELLRLVCKRLAVDPGECVVVGDALSDIRMGRSAGVKLTIGVATGSATLRELEAVADVAVQRLSAISAS